jgi:hypothetical protein
MARFRATIKGNRGEASRLGSAKSGITAKVNGWDAGIRVHGDSMGDSDRFLVFQTGGSNKRSTERLLGALRVLNGSLVWNPEPGTQCVTKKS